MSIGLNNTEEDEPQTVCGPALALLYRTLKRIFDCSPMQCYCVYYVYFCTSWNTESYNKYYGTWKYRSYLKQYKSTPSEANNNNFLCVSKQSVATSRLVSMLPDVHQAHGCVESVEHDQGQRQVIQNWPEHVTVEFVPESAKYRIFNSNKKCRILNYKSKSISWASTEVDIIDLQFLVNQNKIQI